MIKITAGKLATLTTGDQTPDNGIIQYSTVAQSVTASSTSTDTSAINILSTDISQFWEPSAAEPHYIEVERPAGATVDCLCLMVSNLDGASITLEQRDGAVFTTIFAEYTFDSPNNETSFYALMFYFEDADDGDFYRLTIDDKASPKVAFASLGEAIRLPRRVYVGHNPSRFNRKSKVNSNYSENGLYLGRVVESQHLNGSIMQENVTESTYRSLLDPFSRAAVKDPFFYSWRPDAYPDETAYCWSTGDGSAENSGTNGDMTFSLSFRAMSPWI